MAEMQRDRPLRPSDDELIQQCFKLEYVTPIREWLLIQPDKKRETLYGFLRFKPAKLPGVRTTGLPVRPNWTLPRSLDLLAETVHSKIDFNRSLYGPPPWQLDPRAKIPTSVEREGIFGFKEPYPERDVSGEPGRYTVFVLGILFKPNVARDLTPLADDYYPLMNELLKWTEKKTMLYPIDPTRDVPTLRPKTACRIVKQTLEEDRFWESGHRPIRRTKIARDLMPVTGPGGARGDVRSAMSTRYRDVFCDEVHEDYLRSGAPSVTPALKVVANACPFGLFPEVLAKRGAVLPELMRQATDNRAAGHVNKSVFTGDTCL
jgi:hypothetical protein